MVASKRTGQPIPASEPASKAIKTMIQGMGAKHDATGAKLKGLQKLTSGYTPPQGACPTYITYFGKLKALEKDLQTAVHLEKNILFPKTIQLEEELGANSKSNQIPGGATDSKDKLANLGSELKNAMDKKDYNQATKIQDKIDALKPKSKKATPTTVVGVYGYTSCPYYGRAVQLWEGVAKTHADVTVKAVGTTRDVYMAWLKQKTGELGLNHRTCPLILIDDTKVVGGHDDSVAYVRQHYSK